MQRVPHLTNPLVSHLFLARRLPAVLGLALLSQISERGERDAFAWQKLQLAILMAAPAFVFVLVLACSLMLIIFI